MQTKEADSIPVAHDGDWYYLVSAEQLGDAQDLAVMALNRRTQLGRFMANHQLRRLIHLEIDLAVDDTDLEHTQFPPLSRQELAQEIIKGI